MLHTLKIKNFALIADQTINFTQGFNVIIGETGAGKSLILDSLGFVLGDKANKLNLRHDENKMFVQAVFYEDNKELLNFLCDNDIDIDENDPCIIFSRSMNAEGKCESRINGTIVPVSIVKSCASFILDTYAQNENIELLKVKNHITILDSYSTSNISIIKQDVQSLLSSLNEIESNIQTLGGNSENRERNLELLEYQIKDIESANLEINEDEKIKEQLDKLLNYEKIFENTKYSIENLSSSLISLTSSKNSLTNSSIYDNSLSELLERIESAKIEIDDISESLKDYFNNLDFDQAEMERLDKRLEDIKSLKKKYGYTIEEILNYLNKIKIDYDNLLFGEEKLEKLNQQKTELKLKLYEKSKELSLLRKSVAKAIEDNVQAELQLLGFKNTKFVVNFQNFPNIEEANFTKNGLDSIEFLLSANAGESLKSLSKTISGGEMSRFMLALKNVFAKCFSNSTLVFDEVDTGISGEIGQKVAERLAMLSKNYQLICITHLPQVTAMADNYIHVKKSVNQNKTYTSVSYLNHDETIKYIAQVSGAEPTEVAIRFATELKDKANKYKQSLK